MMLADVAALVARWQRAVDVLACERRYGRWPCLVGWI